MRSLKDTYKLYLRTLDFLKPRDSSVPAFLGFFTALLLFVGNGFAVSHVLVPMMAGWPSGGERNRPWNLHPGEYTLIILAEGWKVILSVVFFPGLFWIITSILLSLGKVVIFSYHVMTAWMFCGEQPDPRRPLSPGSVVITMSVPEDSVENTSEVSFTPDSHEGTRPVITIDRDSHPSYIMFHRRRSQGWPESYSANRRASISSNVTMPLQSGDTPEGTCGDRLVNGNRRRMSLEGLPRDGNPVVFGETAEALAR